MHQVLFLALVSSAEAWQHAPTLAVVPRLRPPARAATVNDPSVVAAEAAARTVLGKAGDWGDFRWREQWYPLAFTKTLDRKVPARVELFGDPVVLWFDHVEGRWAALLDRCPHRLAPLSEGRVDERGQIECPYHGWTFESSGTGSCTKIPQAVDPTGDPKLLAKASATPLVLVEKQGLLWGWGQPGALASLLDTDAIPTCAALDNKDDFCWIDVSRDMPYSADMLLENVLDSSHVPFTHHQTISKRENAVPLPLVLTEQVSVTGFKGRFNRDEKLVNAETGADSSGYQGRLTERTSQFRAPSYMHHRIQTAGKEDGSLESGFETWTVAYATPTGPGRCRLFARFPFKFPPPKRGPNFPRLVLSNLPDWMNHMAQLKVLDDDNIFLPLQERRVKAEGGWRGNYVMPTSADTLVTAYRRWFDGVESVPYSPGSVDIHASMLQGGQVDKAALLDRKTQHTDHCVSCSGALKNAKRFQKVAKYALLAALALTPSLAAPCFTAACEASTASRALAFGVSPAGVSASTACIFPAVHSTSTAALFAASVVQGLAVKRRLAVVRATLRALRPLLALAAACAVLLKGHGFAVHVERSLTSGTWTYPPPRNSPAGGAANGKKREKRRELEPRDGRGRPAVLIEY